MGQPQTMSATRKIACEQVYIHTGDRSTAYLLQNNVDIILKIYIIASKKILKEI